MLVTYDRDDDQDNHQKRKRSRNVVIPLEMDHDGTNRNSFSLAPAAAESYVAGLMEKKKSKTGQIALAAAVIQYENNWPRHHSHFGNVMSFR